MQDQHRQVLLFGVSVLVLATGIGLYLKKRHAPSSEAFSQSQQVEKNSDHPQREVATDKPAASPTEEAPRALGSDLEPIAVPGAARAKEVYPTHATDSSVCMTVEYPGDGLQNSQVSRSDWAKVVDQFHEAKKILLKWLEVNRKAIPDKTAALMETQVKNLKVIRPPSIDEPDLSWRGIGVWARDGGGAPTLRLSSGFVKLVLRQSQRALFEMTRLVAQSWAPCELQRLGSEPLWADLLECLNVIEPQACAAGTYSEGGWAVSSTLAVDLASPGCTLPIFSRSEKSECLKRVLMRGSLITSGLKAPETSKEKGE